MSHSVIPAPARCDERRGEFAFRSRLTVAYSDDRLAPIVERFCSDVERRTGLSMTPAVGNPEPGESAVAVELATGRSSTRSTRRFGVSPSGTPPPDERNALTIDSDQIA